MEGGRGAGAPQNWTSSIFAFYTNMGFSRCIAVLLVLIGVVFNCGYSSTTSPSASQSLAAYKLRQLELLSHRSLLLSSSLALAPHHFDKFLPTLQSSTQSQSAAKDTSMEKCPNYKIALSTTDFEYPCLYSYTNPPNTKVRIMLFPPNFCYSRLFFREFPASLTSMRNRPRR